jgi:hypothetical protein
MEPVTPISHEESSPCLMDCMGSAADILFDTPVWADARTFADTCGPFEQRISEGEVEDNGTRASRGRQGKGSTCTEQLLNHIGEMNARSSRNRDD